MTAELKVEDVSVSYSGKRVVEAINFSLGAAEIGCLLGPSGCGKTTLLRAIAGFEPVRQGRILVDQREVSSGKRTVAPEHRNIGMVFQDFALFPHLTVADNILFGLRSGSGAEKQSRVNEMLALVGLPTYGQAYPHQLSGGQKQRVALARAMAPRPDILLLDEPFSSLDVEMREQLAREIRNILKQESITAILVTHDQAEAFAMADSVCVMNEGHIQQHDTAYQLYHEPANRFVADFIGQGVMVQGEVIDRHTVSTDIGKIGSDHVLGQPAGSHVDLLIRPDDIIHDDDSETSAIVVEKVFRGADFLYHLRTDSGVEIMCLAPSHHDHEVNERIGIRVEPDHLVLFEH